MRKTAIKKLLTGILLTGALAALAGCGGKDAGNGGTGQNGSKGADGVTDVQIGRASCRERV